MLAALAFAISNWLVLAGRPVAAGVVLICFVGLLRVSEALNLKADELIITGEKLVIVLQLTKRGVFQKVVCSNIGVLQWFALFVKRCPPQHHVFPVSYNVFARWLRKAAAALGNTEDWTSHSLRRGGATELQRQGVPLADIMLQGRWLSSRSAREYLRKGDLAMLRHESSLPDAYLERLDRFARLGPSVWACD